MDNEGVWPIVIRFHMVRGLKSIFTFSRRYLAFTSPFTNFANTNVYKMKRIEITSVALMLAMCILFRHSSAYAETNGYLPIGYDVSDSNKNGGLFNEYEFLGDGTLRFYRLAIPITRSAYENDFEEDYEDVITFWQECEAFINKSFVPLGLCFDVVEDERLVMTNYLNDLDKEDYELPQIGDATDLLNGVISSSAYDVAVWVTHRDESAENSGLSALGGVYSSALKGNSYAKTDKWVVAHELGHMFGAHHTPQGEGSLMDNGGEYFSYPSIKTIRDRVRNTSSYRNVPVSNNIPQFETEKMKSTYRLPQGAFLSINVYATDIEHNRLMYTAIGCNHNDVDEITGENGMLPCFPSFAPQENNTIIYAPAYIADIYYDDYFYLIDGTDIHKKTPGKYSISILVNDAPPESNYTALWAAPFYCTYTIWEAEVEVIAGTPFSAALSPERTNYIAGEEVLVRWDVNRDYFTTESRLRITMSSDYGETFRYVLADEVRALDGQCSVTLPYINVGKVDVDFTSAVRPMNGGIIKIEEVDGAAFTLTSFDPMDDKSFTISGGFDEEVGVKGEKIMVSTSEGPAYDIHGRRVWETCKGIYIVNGKKIVK